MYFYLFSAKIILLLGLLIFSGYILRREYPTYFKIFVSSLPVAYFTLILSDYLTSYQWFDSLGFKKLFFSKLFWEGLVPFIIFLFVSLLSVYFMKILKLPFIENLKHLFSFLPTRFALIIILIIDFIFSISIAPIFILWLKKVNFGVKYIIYNLDISFFVFSLPLIKTIVNYFLILSIVAFVVALVYSSKAILNALNRMVEDFMFFAPREESYEVDLPFLIYNVLFMVVLNLFVQGFSLVYDKNLIVGLDWVAAYVKLPLIILTALLLFVFAIRKLFELEDNKYLNYTLLFSFLMYILLPTVIQNLVVKPAEFEYQEKFIKNHIEMTKLAYDLENVDYVKVDNLKNNTKIIEPKLWDERIITAFRQLQELKNYYYFIDLDTDRYLIKNKLMQVLIAARELNYDALPQQAKTWVNMKLQYTHGFGAVIASTFKTQNDGMPVFLLKDIPPTGEIQTKNPRIYFGETTNDWVVINTKIKEFDYPKGDQNVFLDNKANFGVKIGNIFNRLLWSIKLSSLNLFVSSYITSDSRIVINRNIIERVKQLMPYFVYDPDPYPIVANDKIYFCIDGYSVLDTFPSSVSLTASNISNFNYLRNSIKVLVDAATGKVEFYLVDKTDIYARVIAKIFPVFKDFSKFPLKNHLKYPKLAFLVRMYVLKKYHMDARSFYNQEDRWSIAKEVYLSDQSQEMLPQYIIHKFPDIDLGFYLILPFTPYNKDNLLALSVGYCDLKNYGKIRVYQFSKDKLSYGPLQIEAKISQDEELSKLFTLWDQRGSQIIRGHLVPYLLGKDNIIWVEPIYLSASTGAVPELKIVALSDGKKVVWGYNFKQAMYKLLNNEKQDISKRINEKIDTKTQRLDKKILTKRLIENWEKAKESLKNNDWLNWATYMKNIDDIIKELKKYRGDSK